MGKPIMPTDEEEAAINAAIASDPDTWVPTDEEFKKAVWGRPPELFPKSQVTIRLDQDIIAHFKGDNPKGWQTRINAALRKAAGLD